MLDHLVLLAPQTAEDDVVATCRDFCKELASVTGQRVTFALDTLSPIDPDRSPNLFVIRTFEPEPPVSAAPMSAAPFVYRDDGTPDWSTMWQGFCDLALYGGPPHRGEEDTLRARAEEPVEAGDAKMLAEIRRGIYETTGLYSELAEPGWLAVTCDSTKMAAWLCATIILENVEARCEGDRLLVPASATFDLKNEVKSVITVVAKTVHYWQQHVESTAAKG